MSTDRKFPSLRDIVKSLIRPDMMAVREFFRQETAWMRNILAEQTAVITSLQQIILTYNDLAIQLVERMTEIQNSINRVIHEKADDTRNATAHDEIMAELHRLQGQLNGISTSITENATQIALLKSQMK